MQHGSRSGKLCQSAMLNKQLVFDITRYTKETTAFIENDAVGCFDRIANPLVLLILRRLGLPRSVVNSLAQIREEITHVIRTQYGISDEGYTNDVLNFLYGPGQGATLGPFLWLLCFIIIATNIKSSSPRMHHKSLDNSTSVTHLGDSFVDDTNLGCTYLPSTDSVTGDTPTRQKFNYTLSALARLAQEWERLLYSTGGALNLKKSFWFAIAWQWKHGVASLVTANQCPGELKMTSRHNENKETVLRIEPTATYRTLGVYLSPSGQMDESFSILREQSTSYATSIIGSHSTQLESYWSYIIYLIPKICYQLPLLTLNLKQCETIVSIVIQALLPKLHINRNTARAIIHGPEDYGGIGLPHLYTCQGLQKITLFLGHMRLQDKTGNLLVIGLSNLQLLSGSGMFVFNLPYTISGTWIEHGWLSSLWEFSSYAKLSYHTSDICWIPEKQRENDSFIMEFFLTMTKNVSILKALNCCRVYLQVLQVSDIATADGCQLLPEVKLGSVPNQKSSLKWPIQGRPSSSDWNV
jgi:hypothetical protein